MYLQKNNKKNNNDNKIRSHMVNYIFLIPRARISCCYFLLYSCYILLPRKKVNNNKGLIAISAYTYVHVCIHLCSLMHTSMFINAYTYVLLCIQLCSKMHTLMFLRINKGFQLCKNSWIIHKCIQLCSIFYHYCMKIIYILCVYSDSACKTLINCIMYLVILCKISFNEKVKSYGSN